MDSLLAIPDDIAPNWKRAQAFLQWQRELLANTNEATLKNIVCQVERLLNGSPFLHYWRPFFLFDLFRGCWAANEYEREFNKADKHSAGAAEMEWRGRQRDDWVARNNDAIKGIEALKRYFYRPIIEDYSPWYFDCNAPSMNEIRRFFTEDNLNFAKLALQVHKDNLDSYQVKQSGFGCVVYLPDLFRVRNRNGGLKIEKGAPQKGYKPFKTANMLAFDLHCRLASWDTRKLPDVGSNPQDIPKAAKRSSLIDSLVAATFPDGWEGNSKQKIREFLRPGVGWQPWPAEGFRPGNVIACHEHPGTPYGLELWGLGYVLWWGSRDYCRLENKSAMLQWQRDFAGGYEWTGEGWVIHPE